ncbi:MAG: AraC family transcriptional regulator [Spirochaetales bacterium]|nr:AraC family transcriptional regulator [Spirochaetales bacterium]
MIKSPVGFPFLTLKTRDEEDYSSRSHSHRQVSLGYIREGETNISVEGRTYLLQKGDLILIPAGTVHLCVPRDREVFRFHMLYIDREWWIKTMGRSPESFSTLALPASSEWEDFFEQLEREETDSDRGAGRFKEGLLALSELYMDEKDSLPNRDRLSGIHRKISLMPQLSVKVEELAREAGMGKFSFIRKYAARYGLTPHADLINCRIQRAILLFETDLSLTDIALDCGFSDQSHFIRQFRLYTGLAPREYRRAILSNSPSSAGAKVETEVML